MDGGNYCESQFVYGNHSHGRFSCLRKSAVCFIQKINAVYYKLHFSSCSPLLQASHSYQCRIMKRVCCFLMASQFCTSKWLPLKINKLPLFHFSSFNHHERYHQVFLTQTVKYSGASLLIYGRETRAVILKRLSWE